VVEVVADIIGITLFGEAGGGFFGGFEAKPKGVATTARKANVFCAVESAVFPRFHAAFTTDPLAGRSLNGEVGG
jgi:hypothetical protein